MGRVGVPGRGQQQRALAQRLHRTIDVPQADKLENIRQLAAAVADGIDHPSALLELLDVDQRHFLYYRQAALILGIVALGDDRALRVTDLGRRLVAAPEASADERQIFAEAIAGARALRPFASFFAGDEVDAPTIAARLRALTGLSKTTAERRAQTLLRWRAFVRGPAALDSVLDLPDLSARLDRLIARHNALAKQRTLEWLTTVAPARFEAIVGDLARALGYVDVTLRGGPRDGGIDVLAHKIDAWGHRARVALQAKRYSRPVGRAVVDEMVGVIARERVGEAVIVATSEFTKQAVDAARGEPRLRLVGGVQLVDLLARVGVVVRYAGRGELVPA